MEHVACEDLLEAVLVLTRKGSPPTGGDLAAFLHRDEVTVTAQLGELAASGKLEMEPGGTVTLLPPGQAIAARVADRHRILECFLAERLGMERQAASGEACHLEHQVSEETIRRLSEFLDGDGECSVPDWRRARDTGEAGPRTLAEYPEGTVLRVAAIRHFSRERRLEDIGLLPGESLTLKRRLSNGSVVVEVKGSEIALSRGVAACILVEEQA
ncbi:MAG: metal-dependent transcriptional regulator [Methanomicrobiales archaeon]|nr:metal-dependent transcriptional regulator [Methanomicrobiales archaeon]